MDKNQVSIKNVYTAEQMIEAYKKHLKETTEAERQKIREGTYNR